MKPIHWFLWLLFIITVTAAAAGAAEVPEDYDPSLRPGAEDGPTPVQVGVFLIDLVNIDDVTQAFTASLYFDVSYKDPRLADPTAPGSRTFSLSEIWWPDLGLVNRRSLQVLYANELKVDREGNVTYNQRVYGDFSAPLNLRAFPYDTQQLPIEVSSNTLGPEELKLSANLEETGRLESLSLTGWSILTEGLEVRPHQIEEHGLEQLVVSLTASRKSPFYRWSILLPLCFIVLMAWCVFWIDPQFVNPQISLSTASTFALIAFRFSLRSMLPKVDYMTYLDEFVLACTALVFLALGQAIFTARLSKMGQGDKAGRIDFWSRYIYLLVFVALTAATLRLNF